MPDWVFFGDFVYLKKNFVYAINYLKNHQDETRGGGCECVSTPHPPIWGKTTYKRPEWNKQEEFLA